MSSYRRGFLGALIVSAARIGLLAALGSIAVAAEPESPAPLKAVFFTGGCCHDYKTLPPLLTGGISKYANVQWTIKEGMDHFKDPKFAEDFDVLVFDNCFDANGKSELADNISRAIRDGKPAVFIHCAMHTLRETDYYKCLGLHTVKHDTLRAFSTKKADPAHPIVQCWPDDWTTPGDELYQNLEFPETSHSLLTAYSVESKKDHVVAWVHTFGKGRAFGTTLGHDTKTAGQDVYQHLLANGLLWTVDKLTVEGKPAAGYEGHPQAKEGERADGAQPKGDGDKAAGDK